QHRRQQCAVGGPVHPPLRAELRGAAARITAPALRTLPARRSPRDDDSVPGSNERDVAPHLLDDARALVSEQDREPRSPALRFDDVEVRVAEPAGKDADEHLAGAGRVDSQLLDGWHRVGLRVDDPARHVARRSCSSSGTSGSLKVSTALGSLTTLSPSSSIVSWSRVTGAPGRRSVSVACTRRTPTGTCTVGRRAPSTRFSRCHISFHVTASGPPISKTRPVAAGWSTART